MAEPSRKNIYIPEDQVEMFKQAEEFAKNNDMSVSMLVMKAVSKFVSDETKNEGEVSLIIKTYERNAIMPTIRYIKFLGEKIAETPFIDNDVDALFCDGKFTYLPPNVVVDETKYSDKDTIGHRYTIYKTKKGKYLAYIHKEHSKQYIDWSGEWTKDIIKQEYSYETYDTINDLVKKLVDLNTETIDELAKSECPVEYLDI